MSLRHYNFITFLKKTLRKIEKKRKKRSENDVVDELEKNSQTRLAVVRIFLIPSTFRKERTRADARNSKGEKRGEEVRRGEGGWLYIHTRTKINYYKPLPFAYSHQFILLRWIPIPNPIPIHREPRARNKGLILSNLCMSNQSPSSPSPPFFFFLLSLLPLLSVSLFASLGESLLVRLGRVRFDRCRRRTWGQKTRSKRETGGGGRRAQATPIMRGPRYPVQIFSSTCVFAQARPAFGREYARLDGSSLNYNQFIRDRSSGGFPSGREIRQTERSWRRTAFQFFFLFFFHFRCP